MLLIPTDQRAENTLEPLDGRYRLEGTLREFGFGNDLQLGAIKSTFRGSRF